MSSLDIHIPFSKIEGLGNDFIVIDCTSQTPNAPPIGESLYPPTLNVQSICDRRHGIGADGVIFIHQKEGDTSSSDSEGAGKVLIDNARMVIFNSDGSRPEICGNGLRCVALYLTRHLDSAHDCNIIVNSDVTSHKCSVFPHEGRDRLQANRVLQAADISLEMPDAHVRAHQVELDVKSNTEASRPFSGISVDIGNPHFVYFTTKDDNIQSYDDLINYAKIWGPKIESHKAFPNRVNVSFVNIHSSTQPPGNNQVSEAYEVDAVVFERGAGLTLACGSGACAIAAASHCQRIAENDRKKESLHWRIRLPGGKLSISTTPSQHTSDDIREFLTTMTGPAKLVYQGRFFLPTFVQSSALSAARKQTSRS